jgi:two-component system response regulator HydG
MALNGHILIIDDEASLRQTLTRILQRAGLQVTSAASGQEGLDYLTKLPFDLVYLDIRMPDMDGMEVLKIMHAAFPELPVVLFTAQPDLSSALEALRRGATDYLLKPLQPNDIVERTRAILTRRQTEQRKQEIQEQIEALQTELRKLTADVSPPTDPESVT